MASSQTIRDFILISEFCEVEGPRCVLTIPAVLPHLNNNENFNLDEFLLYIMTTDYQNFPGEKLDEISDVPCIRTNIIQNFHAILHYFTLKDSQARGGVRPSCIAYITQNQTKLYRLKNEILNVLNMSAQILKNANMRWMGSLGQDVGVQENNTITSLLDKWNHLTQPEPELGDQEKKLKPWHLLCPIGISIVISGLIFVYKITCRPLEDQILDPKVICSTYDLFTNVNPDNVDFKAVMSQLNSFIL
ncbi:guanine nucleotide exchange protein smcr8a-like isoform X1 [Daphnia pulex]|uniref:UDENN FLCN/SMCR8-type domain-containing protein n=1 Tax=Daphnia pulex TaxID=6669 RepID=E9GA07_DAPPU|nr:guanine nucleotide exchange protein smcr8a-like isoform X1 [Daphnia pulex]EFX83660.1 hypothetical protein DAPPUDRAFT_100304 [Daphnia pulex]|eukprot:EFX83660.1 hypothetical protein DAPPUDRAFT_100304 [Daphnia pulex]